MKADLEEKDIQLNEEEQIKFELLLAIFQKKNAELNLSAIRDEADIIQKHFIDSIYLNIFVELHGKVLDIGTGG
jgi:16S rRNA (guanine527-N7)-methyltransferase